MRRERLPVLLGALFLLAVAVRYVELRTYRPLEAVWAEADRHGWTAEERVPLAGGRSTHLLEWRAHGSFASLDGTRELYVEVRKPSLLHDWRLREYRERRRAPTTPVTD